MRHPSATIMRQAITLADDGASAGDYRLGALVVDAEGALLSSAHTSLKTSIDPTAHAEILAIRRAASATQSRILRGCWLYSTLEPCPMCTSAAIWAKMEGIVFGALLEDALRMGREQRDGKSFSWRQIRIKASYVAVRGDPQVSVVEGFLREDCIPLLGERS